MLRVSSLIGVLCVALVRRRLAVEHASFLQLLYGSFAARARDGTPMSLVDRRRVKMDSTVNLKQQKQS